MTREECAKLMALITVSFPAYLRGMSNDEKQGAVSLWWEFIGDFDTDVAYYAVKEYLHTTESLYSSDNVPLAVETIRKRIRRAINEEYPVTKFRLQHVNGFVSSKRKRRNKLLKSDMKSLPPTWEKKAEDGH